MSSASLLSDRRSFIRFNETLALFTGTQDLMTYIAIIFIAGIGLLSACTSQTQTQSSSTPPLVAATGSLTPPQATDTQSQPDLIENHHLLPSHNLPEARVKHLPEAQVTPPKVLHNAAQKSPDVWEIIAGDSRFSRGTHHKRVIKYLNWYQGKQYHFDRINPRVQLYMAYIVKALQAHDMPLELALLPFVESAYDPFASSPSGAAGLWQFMPLTGKHLGLENNSWYDGRKDIVRSTQAAIRYLKYLNTRFKGDWLLTLAAYNAGEGNLAKALRMNKQQGLKTDYWSLKLPRETQAYIPKLIALAQIAASPEKFQLVLSPINSDVYFRAVELPQQIGLSQASRLAKIDIDLLYRLNPGFQQSATPPQGPHTLLLPADKVDNFKIQLAGIPKKHWLKTRQYTVKSGDTLSEIALHHQTSVQSLIQQNKLKNKRIKSGQVLIIPNIKPAALPRFAQAKRSYRVRKGDSLWKIARAHNTSIRRIARRNRLNPKATLKVGTRLNIPAS